MRRGTLEYLQPPLTEEAKGICCDVTIKKIEWWIEHIDSGSAFKGYRFKA